ncbi:MAG TPA: glycosyl hydrolase [Nocardioidaceae bacterium]|nr:glycosyl hydrolase [Nocardioidaceae bacterium]
MQNESTSSKTRSPGSARAGGEGAVSRRTLLGAAAATAGAAAAGGVFAGSSAAAPGHRGGGAAGLPGRLAAEFARPRLDTAAGFRWWWPHGRIDPDEITREVDQVADAGFGVLEIADVTHSLRARDIEFDLSEYGWGTPSWVAGVTAALRQAMRRRLRIDITVGPSWPAAVSTITPDDEAACSELAHGRIDVEGGSTYEGRVPEPVVAAHPDASERTLVAVNAYRVEGSDDEVTTLAQESYVDLSDAVTDGRLSWSAPDDGAWVILAYWQRGSGQEPEAGPHTKPKSWVVDHFSAAGSNAVIDLWQSRVLNREMRRLLRIAGGYLFEDSLEIETDATVWTPRMVEEFRTRAGYDLLPYLPVVVEQGEEYVFDFSDVQSSRIRDDFNQVISDLYRDHHLRPLQRFARSLGMGLRVQPYGLETDAAEHSALLDVPESESLGFNNLDDYRVLTGGRDMGGRTVLSCEAACYFGAAYQTTWERALQTINSIFVAGVNHAMLHGFSYAEAPDVTWPGFAAFSPYYDGAIGYGESWGPRMPQWRHMPDIAGYLARTQLLLQTGTPRYDIVFLRQKGWGSTGLGPYWITNNGTEVGWSHSFVTAPLLDLPRATVRDGRLAPDGPAYKAMVVGPDKFRGRETTIEVETARRVLEFARAGLPVVMYGDWSQADPVGLPRRGETNEVRRLMSQLAALPTTRKVLEEDEIGDALADLGITSDVSHDPSTVMHVRRDVGDVEIYYLANAKHAENRQLERVTQEVWLTSRRTDSVPVVLDAWTGEVRPVGLWERNGKRIRVDVDLLPGQSTVVALVPRRGRDPVHATASTADAVRVMARHLMVRTSSAGTVSTTLSNGRRVRTHIDRVRKPIALTSWDLEVEDWVPGDGPTETVRRDRSVQLDALAPWTDVSGLEDVSGVGRYRTVVDLGRHWTSADGALLELGGVTDTFRVRVNGRSVGPCDVLDPTVDVGRFLRRGRNVIEVEVTTTLINRLRTVTPDVYGAAERQEYGLLGPARLVPYVERRVRTRGRGD